MKRFIFKIVLLLVLVLLGLKITDRMFPTRVFLEDTLKVFKKSEEAFQIMFFGSSHAYCSYDPRVFETELGVNAIVFSSGAQRLTTTNFIIQETVKKNKPELIVVDIFVNSIGTYKSEKQYQFQMQALDHFPTTFKKIELIHTNYGLSSLPKSLSSTLRFHNKWTKLGFEDYTRELYLAPRHDFYNGFKTTLTKFSDSVGRAAREIQNSANRTPPDSLTQEEKQGIDALIETLRDTGAEFMFVNAPSLISEMNPRYEGYTQLIKSYIEEKGVSFLDINAKADSLGLTREYYRDPDHLNQKGALIVSEFLANYISSKYTLSTATFSNTHLNRYQHIKENFVNTPYYNRFDSLTIQKNSIKGAAMYKATGHKYEVLLELKDTVFNPFEVKFEYLDNGDPKSYVMQLTEQDVIEYRGRKFAIASLLYESDGIENLVLYGGMDEKNIVTVKNNKLIENKPDTEVLIFQKQTNKKLIEHVTINHLEVLKKKSKYVFKVKFSDSIRYLDKSYNLAIHILPNQKDKRKVQERNAQRNMFFDNVDIAVKKENDTLIAEMTSSIEHIDRIKLFLYNSEGYDGVLGETLWIQNDAFIKTTN